MGQHSTTILTSIFKALEADGAILICYAAPVLQQPEIEFGWVDFMSATLATISTASTATLAATLFLAPSPAQLFLNKCRRCLGSWL